MTNRNLLALILLIVFTLTGCQTAAVPAPAPEAAPAPEKPAAPPRAGRANIDIMVED